MGVGAKWGRFPIVPECPVLSPFVLFCPDLSPFRAPRRTKEDRRGQNGTFRDKLGNAPIYHLPPFSSPQEFRCYIRFVVLSCCCCCPFAGADYLVLNLLAVGLAVDKLVAGRLLTRGLAADSWLAERLAADNWLAERLAADNWLAEGLVADNLLSAGVPADNLQLWLGADLVDRFGAMWGAQKCLLAMALPVFALAQAHWG